MEKKREIIHVYPDLYELEGSILDGESYRRHLSAPKTKQAPACSQQISFASSAFTSYPTSGSFPGSGFYGGYGLHLI